MIYLLLAAAGLLWAGAASASKKAAEYATEASGGIVRVSATNRPKVLEWLKTKIATLQGAPTAGVPLEPGGRTVILVDPPRASAWDTMPAREWVDLAQAQGFAVLMTFDGLLAAVQRSEIARWATIGGRWVVLVE